MILTQSFGLDQNQHRQDDFYPTQLDLDLDFDLDLSADDNSSIASSLRPISPSTEYGAVLSEASPVTFESLSAFSVPRQASGAPSQFPTSLSSPPAAGHQPLATHLMQPDTWLVGGHYTPRSAARFSHNRESSLSSLGSTGPASPYNTNTSNPHIAVTDSATDGFADLHAHENSYYHPAKTMAPPHVGLYADYHTVAPDVSMPQHPGLGGAAAPRHRDDRGLLPAPDFPGAYGPTRSHPTSVASSVAGDSPATPSIGEPEDHRRRKAVFDSVPKLDRTMTDVYGDGLYSPEFTITSPSTLQLQPLPVSPSRDVFAQRLQAANSQHLSAAQSPSLASSRSRSPFTHGSPLAPTAGHDFGAVSSAAAAASRSRLGSTQERFKADQLVGQRRSEPETPKTISPKDAVLEFHDAEGDASPFPLFHSLQETALLYDQVAKQTMAHGDGGSYPRGQPPSSTSADGPFPYATAQIPVSIQVPQQYPFIARPRRGNDDAALAIPTDSKPDDLKAGPPRPGNVGAESGTYSCTYHGCMMRFATPALLQKHKREGHRQAHSLAGGRRPEGALVASTMTQAGPHRCDRINPSTGKPCDSIFSRPYDLTRHEDTIHNARKQKVRCNLCTEEKTFSRADALTRHFRVCHPDVEFPGKHRRRGAAQD